MLVMNVFFHTFELEVTLMSALVREKHQQMNSTYRLCIRRDGFSYSVSSIKMKEGGHVW
jgi:hypothetical protein